MGLNSISLTSLFASLLGSLQTRDYTTQIKGTVLQTTIRLEPEVRAFYEEVANQLNTSLQGAISVALKGIMTTSQQPSKSNLELMYDRFFEVFVQHNIPIADIPEFLPNFNITRSTLSHKDKLVDLLDHKVLDYLAKTFFLNIAWLKGESDFITTYSEHKWYKSTVCFCNYLNELSANNDIEIIFISNKNTEALRQARFQEDHSARMGICIAYRKETSTDRPYTYYELFECEPWGYEKSRLDLKAIMLFCLKNGFRFRGRILKEDLFRGIFSRSLFVSYALELSTTLVDPLDYVTASGMGNKDTDELLTVIDYYCEDKKIHQQCDGENQRPSTGFISFSPDFTNYKYSFNKKEKLPLETYYKGIIPAPSMEIETTA